MTSCPHTSSFLTWSPVTLVPPATPSRPRRAACASSSAMAEATAALLLTSACVSHVPRYQVLPGQGQSSETLDRDRYECGLQAQKQTNYDPGGSMTAGALTGLIVGGPLGAGLGAAAGISGGVVGTGASV